MPINSAHDIDPESQQDQMQYQDATQQTFYDAPLTLEQFRTLVGIPQDAIPTTNDDKRKESENAQNGLKNATNPGKSDDMPHSTFPIRPATVRALPTQSSRILVFAGVLSRPSFARRWRRTKAERSARKMVALTGTSEEDEYATSLYYSLVCEESDQWRLYHIYNIITYACLILQLVIASALVIVGAIPNNARASGNADTYRGHRIAVAILGAITGLLTGVLSLLKGQGLPIRFLQYASRLRQVRDKIELTERTLRAGIPCTYITYQHFLDLWHEYENVINERDMNRPDAWASMNIAANSTDSKGGTTSQNHPLPNMLPSVVQSRAVPTHSRTGVRGI
ncbi:hypothetical protein OHC33_009755 [Knufia fluminis]|uniref:SMODS and SLOG-associating 2TM effector domain-containing protein n=1 Tax=Knufia fluminis TaxID=191047 RepID=A0AAN8E8T5_9EURO|nr:hypothetical protein OHC33_009755 [Knufia fluminis]